jgi:hypothetical protein
MRYSVLQNVFIIGILCILKYCSAEAKPDTPDEGSKPDEGGESKIPVIFTIHKTDSSGKPTDEYSPIRIIVMLALAVFLIVAILAVVGIVFKKK